MGTHKSLENKVNMLKKRVSEMPDNADKIILEQILDGFAYDQELLKHIEAVFILTFTRK